MTVRWRFFPWLAALIALGVPMPRSQAAEPFEQKVLPFLQKYCTGCHNPRKSKGDLDLTRFTSAAKVAEGFRQWEHVQTFLKKEEMPPAKHPNQPTAAERADALQAIAAVLKSEAVKRAGDPGVVPPRRLTNAEYDYTIRDLTGVITRLRYNNGLGGG